MMRDANERLARLDQALSRLREALEIQSPSQLEIDGAIQRFEFTYELSWKAIQATALLEGHEVSSPRQSIRQAFQMGWIENESAWLSMMRDRNLTSHTYNEALAREIYERLPDHLTAIEALAIRLREL